ncbi:MAG TPA: DNA replication/repair protein RecF [Acidimicrobiales bacterium]|nr:DNA replication/repair protein RecF [Acidimicrobiales bacterium]
MRLTQAWLTDFRNYAAAEIALPGGLTVIVGDNGSGKTNLLEAVGYLARLESFRGAPAEALVRQGAERAVVRGEASRGGRTLLVEAEIPVRGRGRVAVNRQPLRRAADLVGALVVTVFAPDDLELVKGGPAARRRYLDDLLVALHPRHDALRRDLERILRQRTALLRESGGRLSDAIAPTLDVWDTKLAAVGDALGAARADLVARLEPELAAAYAGIAGPDARPVAVAYEAPWRSMGLAAALEVSRTEELRRGVCLVGPHRDELAIGISGMPARTQASQGEQRSMALALRLAGHRVVGEALGEPPVLLLDDVFSELDDRRSQALLDHLPLGQALLTTTGAIPPAAAPDLVVEVTAARLAVRHTVRGASGSPGDPHVPETVAGAAAAPLPEPSPHTVRGASGSPGDPYAPKTGEARMPVSVSEPVSHGGRPA